MIFCHHQFYTESPLRCFSIWWDEFTENWAQRKSPEKQIRHFKAAVGLTAAAFSSSPSRLLQLVQQSNWSFWTASTSTLTIRCVCKRIQQDARITETQARPPEWVGVDRWANDGARLVWGEKHRTFYALGVFQLRGINRKPRLFTISQTIRSSTDIDCRSRWHAMVYKDANLCTADAILYCAGSIL